MVDFAYMQLENDQDKPAALIFDVEMEQTISEVYIGRRFEMEQGLVTAYGGVRLWVLDYDLDVNTLAGGIDQVSRGDEWVDPVIGLGVMRDLSDDWFLMLKGDIGGFGLNSDFSWNIQGGVGYDINDTFSVVAQYRYLDVDFDNEKDGIDRIAYDAATHGALIGLVIRP